MGFKRRRDQSERQFTSPDFVIDITRFVKIAHLSQSLFIYLIRVQTHSGRRPDVEQSFVYNAYQQEDHLPPNSDEIRRLENMDKQIVVSCEIECKMRRV